MDCISLRTVNLPSKVVSKNFPFSSSFAFSFLKCCLVTTLFSVVFNIGPFHKFMYQPEDNNFRYGMPQPLDKFLLIFSPHTIHQLLWTYAALYNTPIENFLYVYDQLICEYVAWTVLLFSERPHRSHQLLSLFCIFSPSVTSFPDAFQDGWSSFVLKKRRK